VHSPNSFVFCWGDSVLKELSLSKDSDHAYKAKEALDSLAKRGGGMEKLLNSNDISK
jgi:hypothetical protein